VRVCSCTELTGECQHDCPTCGGEGFFDPHRRSKLTPEDIDELMAKSQKNVAELREALRTMFAGPLPNLRVR